MTSLNFWVLMGVMEYALLLMKKNPNKQCLVWRHARWISFACSFFPQRLYHSKHLWETFCKVLNSCYVYFFFKPCNIIVHIGLDRSLSLYVNSSLYYIHSLFILLLRFFSTLANWNRVNSDLYCKYWFTSFVNVIHVQRRVHMCVGK